MRLDQATAADALARLIVNHGGKITRGVDPTAIMKAVKNSVEIAGARGLRAYRHAIANGVLLRPLGDVLYWMPPYCIGDDALDHLADVTRGAIDAAFGDVPCA